LENKVIVLHEIGFVKISLKGETGMSCFMIWKIFLCNPRIIFFGEFLSCCRKFPCWRFLQQWNESI